MFRKRIDIDGIIQRVGLVVDGRDYDDGDDVGHGDSQHQRH